MSQLRGTSVVITGGASGIGLLMARIAADAGAQPIIWDRDRLAIDKALDVLHTLGHVSARGDVVDVTDVDGVNEAARKVLAECGTPGVVVNNAGVVSGARLLDLTDQQIKTTFEVNALAPYWVTRAFLPKMIEERRGHLVTIASAAGLVGVARQTDYSASKHAAVGFTESIRVELAQVAPSIKTTLVCPYYISTGMFEGVRSRLSFMLPILEPERVARRIVKAIEHDKDLVVMPWAVGLLPIMRLLPVRAFDATMDLLGVNHSMDRFTGRSGRDASA